MSPVILIIIFLAATVVGYFIINNVPSLLHTPLMSGMNALSGITILGALAVTAVALKSYNSVLSIILGVIAIVLAIINVAAGFGITARMLKMFKGEDKK
ncbi:MAG: NAD(P) transhydrogenase subunit alpha [Clostridia bacterium]|nr:NAD(P) transhydrogenase subunit alpha [Clostridia bacterium]